MKDLQALRRALAFGTDERSRTPSVGAKPSPKDRRRSVRYTYVAEGTGALLQRPDESATTMPKDFPVITLSLSQTGLAFLANFDLATGAVAELTLPTKEGRPKQLRVKIVRSKRAGLSAFELGGEFAEAD